MANKIVVAAAVIFLLIVGAVLAVLLSTVWVRESGENVEEVFCDGPGDEIVLCEDLP